jgi:predicted HicB family RNase H-like nuclease
MGGGQRTAQEQPMTNERKILSVSMRPDVFEAVKAEAQNQDVPVTVWVRQAIEQRLGDGRRNEAN